MARVFFKSGLSLRGCLSQSALALLFVAGSALAQVPAAPNLSSPAHEASRIQSATFTWDTVPGATSYHIQVSGAYNFGTMVVNDSSLTSPTFASPVFNPRTVYFWRVRGKNGSGVGSWSTIRAFTTIVPLPAPDSAGWIRLFRGTNTADFFSAPNNSTPPGRTLTTFPASPYTVTGDTIRVSGNPAGQFYFKQPFSHYKIRYQIRFPNFTGTNNGGTGNCGMLLHVQAHDNPTNGFPRSVEAQGDPTQGMGQLWAIGDVWVDVRARTVSGRRQYDSTQPIIVHGGLNWNSESRVTVGVNGWALPTFASVQEGGWVTMEAHVFGSDSIIHLVNGVPRIKYYKPRVSSGGTPNNVTKYLTRGLIAWQSEGTAVWYRNIEIQLLPGDTLYTPTSLVGSAARATRKAVEAPRLNLDAASPSVLLPDGAGTGKKFDMRGRNQGSTDIPSVNKTAE